jgi:flagellar hook assembly protein FlgD
LAQNEGFVLPEDFNLTSYPNPFNPRAIIEYKIPSNENVDVAIFDIAGRKVIQLDQGYRLAGTHSLTWDARNSYGQQIATGLYILRIQAGRQLKMIKITYLR